MSNHRLSLEQRFRLETAFREIDACDDIEMLREITKQIITSEENEKSRSAGSNHADEEGAGVRIYWQMSQSW